MSILEIYYRHYGNVTNENKKQKKSFRSCSNVGAAIANRILSICITVRPRFNRILSKFAYLNSSTTDDK